MVVNDCTLKLQSGTIDRSELFLSTHVVNAIITSYIYKIFLLLIIFKGKPKQTVTLYFLIT